MNQTASAPTLLAPYRANEETALRYSNSCTLLNLTGSTPDGEGYSLIVTKHGERSFRVTWNVRTLEVAKSYKTVRNAYWRAIGWSASAFRTEAKAAAFAAAKLDTLRGWAEGRATKAA